MPARGTRLQSIAFEPTVEDVPRVPRGGQCVLSPRKSSRLHSVAISGEASTRTSRQRGRTAPAGELVRLGEHREDRNSERRRTSGGRVSSSSVSGVADVHQHHYPHQGLPRLQVPADKDAPIPAHRAGHPGVAIIRADRRGGGPSSSSKKLMSRVRPGVRLVRARSRRPVSALMALDFPAFDRPANATSRPRSGGRPRMTRDAGEKSCLAVVDHGARTPARETDMSSGPGGPGTRVQRTVDTAGRGPRRRTWLPRRPRLMRGSAGPAGRIASADGPPGDPS